MILTLGGREFAALAAAAGTGASAKTNANRKGFGNAALLPGSDAFLKHLCNRCVIMAEFTQDFPGVLALARLLASGFLLLILPIRIYL